MSDRKKERLRGLKESRAAIERLQSLWPAAFPRKSHLIKPLASGLRAEIVDGTGWTLDYVRGVLAAWTLRPGYCQAILRHNQRVNLQGKKTDSRVLDDARAMAQQRLEKIAARRRKQEEERQKTQCA
jgi:sRNA-binding protein